MNIKGYAGNDEKWTHLRTSFDLTIMAAILTYPADIPFSYKQAHVCKF